MRLLIITLSTLFLLPCSTVIAQEVPCDLNGNGFVDVGDLVLFNAWIEHDIAPPYPLPIYDSNLDCDRDSLHLTMNDLTGLAYSLYHGPAWGQGRQWWLPSDSLYIPEVEASPGDDIDIPIYLQTDHRLTYVQIALRYDPRLLKIDDFIISDSIPYGYDPRQALYTGICSRNYVYEAPGIQLFFTHPVTVDGVIRIIDRGRRDAGKVNRSLFGLEAFPNPFNNSTRLTLELKENTTVKITIYDLLGRQVAILADGNLPSGRHDIIWEAGDLPSGIYLCRVKAGDVSATEKITLLR